MVSEKQLIARGSAWIPDTGGLAPRSLHDWYPTPENVIEDAFTFLLEECPQYSRQRRSGVICLDPGPGDGVWGGVAHRFMRHPLVDGVEIQEQFDPPISYVRWFSQDFFEFAKESGNEYNLIFGNPPYREAEKFIRASLELLEPGGHLLFLLRLAFLEGQARGSGLWREHPPKAIAVCSKRPSFTGDGKTDATAYAVYLFEKGWRGNPKLCWIGNRD